MKRYQPPEPHDALPDEFQRLWDAIRRIREANARAILPYGYEFDVAGDGSIRIVQNGAVVTISGSDTDIDLSNYLTQGDIDAICEECGGGDTIIVEGGTGGLAGQRIVTVSGPVLDTDSVVLAQQAGAISLDLPASATVAFDVIVKDQLGAAGSFPVTINAPGGSAIDGLPSYPLNVPYRAIRIGRAAAGDFFIV